IILRGISGTVPAWARARNIQHDRDYGSLRRSDAVAARCGGPARLGDLRMATTISQKLPKPISLGVWIVVVALGTFALSAIALNRGESIDAMWFIVAAVCVYAVGYRFYSAFLAAKVLALDGTRATPAERFSDGRDFVPTNRWIVFGHHFAAIAGPGPLIG